MKIDRFFLVSFEKCMHFCAITIDFSIFTARMEGAARDWIDLITEMLWILEREIKTTLRGINDDFKITGLTFDNEFRNHFIQIISKRYENYTKHFYFFPFSIVV